MLSEVFSLMQQKGDGNGASFHDAVVVVRPQCGQASAAIETLPPQSGQRYKFGELLLERFCDRITKMTTAMTITMGAASIASITAKMIISVKPSPNILCSSHEIAEQKNARELRIARFLMVSHLAATA